MERIKEIIESIVEWSKRTLNLVDGLQDHHFIFVLVVLLFFVYVFYQERLKVLNKYLKIRKKQLKQKKIMEEESEAKAKELVLQEKARAARLKKGED